MMVFLIATAYLTLIERRVVARFQVRLGPIKTGPLGILQPLADLIKLITKEDIVVANASKGIYVLAPLLMWVPAFITFAVIPFGSSITLFGRQIDLVISDFNIGILYIFAATALGVYGVVLAGWSSNSKYSLLGALRSSAQMISYEVTLGLSIVGVLLLAQTTSMVEIVQQQSHWYSWFIFRQPAGFFLFMTAAIAETNRAPFDLPEAESELVAGYNTEYSAMKFGMFYVAEYANMITVAAIATTMFLGGWQGPILPALVWFIVKVFAILFLYIWVRATLPRFRYDQLMNFGWKVLLPLALINIMVTAALAL